MACETPVFRFALLKWVPDQYQCIVYHRAPLSMQQQAVFDRMKSAIGSPLYLNCFTRQIGINGTISSQEKAVADSLPDGIMPCIALYHPLLRFGKKPFFRGPVTEETVDKIIASPLRTALTNRIVSGDAGIWLLIKSGNARKNRRAEKILSASIKRMQDSCALPGQKTEEKTPHVQGTKIPFRITFSLLKLSLDDPKETLLTEYFRSIPGFPTTDDEPVAMLLFGRGRMHVPLLTGEHITDSSLTAAYRYILGMCSCVEKEQNPGEDLLMAVDWGAELAGESGPAEEMPDLISPAAYMQVLERALGSAATDSLCPVESLSTALITAQPAPTTTAVPPRKSRSTLYLVGTGVLIVLFIFLPLLLMRRRKD